MSGRLGAYLLVGKGGLLLLFGLLFLVGSAGLGSRYLIAGVALGLGALLLAWGMVLHRRADARDPSRLRGIILGLARESDGVVTEGELKAELGDRWPFAQPVLEDLVWQGVAALRAPRTWVFAGMQPRLAVRRCQSCQATLPLEAQLTTCPACGGAVELQVERVDLEADSLYNMDE